VTDFNENRYIDAKDLLSDSRWIDRADNERDGYKDDLVGWNFVAGTNDPFDDNGHGTHTRARSGQWGTTTSASWASPGTSRSCRSSSSIPAAAGRRPTPVSAINLATKLRGLGTNVVETSNSWSSTEFSSTLSNAITKKSVGGDAVRSGGGELGDQR